MTDTTERSSLPPDVKHRPARRSTGGRPLSMTPFHAAGIAFLFVGFALACYQGLQQFGLVPRVSWVTWTHIHFVTIGAFTQLVFGTLSQLMAQKLERSRIVDGVAGLTQQGHLVLYALVMLHEEGETPTRARTIQDRYEIVCERAATDPLVPRRMRDHLNELSMLGIASRVERNKGEVGGRYYEYSLDTSPDLLLEVLDETVDMVEITEAIQKRLNQSY